MQRFPKAFSRRGSWGVKLHRALGTAFERRGPVISFIPES